jgi:putative CocE/NonD family hydrolase
MAVTVIRRSLRIPMRDRVHLAADLYLPGEDGVAVDQPVPVILERTPYNKSGISRSETSRDRTDPLTRTEVAEYFSERGYAVVMQDCRGRFGSEGEFTKYVNEAQDGFDTVQWIARQNWCDGRVGTMGLSYGAHVQCALAALSPSGLTCMFIDSGGFSNAFQSGIRQSGAFEMKQATWAYRHALLSPRTQSDPQRKASLLKVDIVEWMRELDWQPGHSPLAAAPEYEAYFFEQWRNGLFDDYWQRPGLLAEGRYDEFPDIPIAIVGSWYDPYVLACTTNFRGFREHGVSPVHLLVGPWTHGDRAITYAGGVDFGEAATLDDNIAEHYLALRLAWFDEHLGHRDRGVTAFRHPVTYFQMGGGRALRNDSGRLLHGGRWQSANDWPPQSCHPRSWYLHPDRSLCITASESRSGSISYKFDPRDPVPTIGGSVTSGEPVMHGGAFDQVQNSSTFAVRAMIRDSPLSLRHDVIVFQTEPLGEDLVVSGRVFAELWVSSDRPDTDFTVKLIDVYPRSAELPDGFAMNLSDGIFRMRYRSGWDREVFMKKDEIYAVEVHAFDVSNLFAKGHRIRLDISSSNYPRFDVNPNTGKPSGDMSDPKVAHNTIFCGGDCPSRLVLDVES